MERNIRKKLKNTKGITLVALVVTIIVLIILAGVSLSMVLSQDGIFSRAEQATDKYGQSKAGETLELALGEAQMQKYEEGLTEEQLDNKINEIGELLPKENPNSNNQQVIVDGSIFEIDRSVPKIVDYIGPADGVVITAVVTQNGNWQNPVATVKGTIKTYSGGNIINSTATVVSGNANVASFPTTGGNYTIENITEDTDIKITATDNKDKSNEKVVRVRLVRDNTPPTLSNLNVTAIAELKMQITARAEDTQSGVKSISYSITSATLTIPITGTFLSGETAKATTPTGTTYIVTVIAEDNAGNKSEAQTAEVETGITVAEVKSTVNASNIADYIGTKVIDYNPTARGTWRVFYYDSETITNEDGTVTGYFGPKNTVYLKRDPTSQDTTLTSHTSHTPSDGGTIMKRMNPKWGGDGSPIRTINERCASWLSDPEEWTNYKTSDSSFAIGSPSVEMYMKAFNLWKTGNANANNLVCKVDNVVGYSVGANGEYQNSGEYTNNNTIEPGPNNIFMEPGQCRWWLASPSFKRSNLDYVLGIAGSNASVKSLTTTSTIGVCPLVPLDL